MTIETERLRLRPFEVSDATWYFDVTREKKIQDYVSTICPDSIEEATEDVREYYSKVDFIYEFFFVLEDKETYERLGTLFATEDFNDRLGIDMFIAENYRGKGYMVEALKGFSQSVSEGNVLLFVIHEENESSLKAVQKLDEIVEITSSYSGMAMKNYRVFVLETKK